MSTKVNWPIGNDEVLGFDVYPPNTNWNDVPGLYIFGQQTAPDSWRAVYVGKADSFLKRPLSKHERWAEAVRLGASHIHALIVQSQSTRDTLESALIKTLQPPLNTYHR